jgi:hypothetical protein
MARPRLLGLDHAQGRLVQAVGVTSARVNSKAAMCTQLCDSPAGHMNFPLSIDKISPALLTVVKVVNTV